MYCSITLYYDSSSYSGHQHSVHNDRQHPGDRRRREYWFRDGVRPHRLWFARLQLPLQTWQPHRRPSCSAALCCEGGSKSFSLAKNGGTDKIRRHTDVIKIWASPLVFLAFWLLKPFQHHIKYSWLHSEILAHGNTACWEGPSETSLKWALIWGKKQRNRMMNRSFLCLLCCLSARGFT